MNTELFDTFVSQAERIRRLRGKHEEELNAKGRRLLLNCELAKWQDARDAENRQ